jgi:opacity protein-like surface antigen
MNTTSHKIKSMLLASALALGLGVAARADDAATAAKVVPVAGSQGLLGQVYGTLTYDYINLDGPATHADSYSFLSNQPLAFGLDGVLGYNFTQWGTGSGARVNQNTLNGAIRAFSTSYNWGKPYVEAGAGYTSVRAPGAKDNSFVWEGAAGVEFQVAPRATVTPFVQYTDAPDLAGGSKWNFGAKANYWIDSQWSVTAGLARDNHRNTAFTVGTNFRY